MIKKSLGLCCHYLENDKNKLKQTTLKLGAYQDDKYSKERIIKSYNDNVHTLVNYLPAILDDYPVFRMPSGIFPLFDQVPRDYWDNDIIGELLCKLGKIILEKNARVTFHPAQFCSLSSDNEQVINNSIKEIEHHAWIFDTMGIPKSNFYCINVHGGKANKQDNLKKNINRLNDSAKSRLSLENDETSYSISDLIEVSKDCDVPLVWDSHHHSFNPGNLSEVEAMELAIQTWKVKPLQHISNSRDPNGNFQKRRAHSDYITYIPDCQLKSLLNGIVDIDVEAKMKNLAIDNLVKMLTEPNSQVDSVRDHATIDH